MKLYNSCVLFMKQISLKVDLVVFAGIELEPLLHIPQHADGSIYFFLLCSLRSNVISQHPSMSNRSGYAANKCTYKKDTHKQTHI